MRSIPSGPRRFFFDEVKRTEGSHDEKKNGSGPPNLLI
jgi:hypothetical protein